MDMMKMGAFLQQLRKEKGLTQEQLGERLHVSGKTVSRWETGMYMPPMEALLSLSELYGLTINELLCGAPTAAGASAAPAPNPFPPEEQKAYWQRKWLLEHRAALILLAVAALAVQITGGVMNRVEINAIGSILTVGAAALLRNAQDSYVEHHLYDHLL